MHRVQSGDGAALYTNASPGTTYVSVHDVPLGETKLYVAERRSSLEAPEFRLRVWSASFPDGQSSAIATGAVAIDDELQLRVGDDLNDQSLLGEVMVYSRAMAGAEVDAVASYLGEKWGVLE